MKYSDMVTALAKKGEDIIATLTPQKAELWHGAVGVTGEAGELSDAIKRYAVYNKDIDRANVIEELGDLEFFMEHIRQNLGISREETLDANMAKLAVRYNNFLYSDTAAQTRADKEPGQ